MRFENQPPPPPPPPPYLPFSETGGSNSIAPQRNGSASKLHSNNDNNDDDFFEDDRAWEDVGSANRVKGGGEREAYFGAPAAKRDMNISHQGISRAASNGERALPWPGSSTTAKSSSAGPQGSKPSQAGPSQSKLVQRVFGALGRRGRGGEQVVGRGRQTGDGGAMGVQDDEGEQGEGSDKIWAVQAELQGKLQELEDEVKG